MKKYLFLAAVLLSTAAASVRAQTKIPNDFQHLKSWAGKYATDKSGKATREILRLPEVRLEMIKVLGKSRYADLFETYDQDFPIDLIGDYLIVGERRKWADDEFEHLLYVVINTNSGSNKIYVGYLDGERENWFSNDAESKKPTIVCRICAPPE